MGREFRGGWQAELTPDGQSGAGARDTGRMGLQGTGWRRRQEGRGPGAGEWEGRKGTERLRGWGGGGWGRSDGGAWNRGRCRGQLARV